MVDIKLIGEKSKFAIEYKLSEKNSRLGCIRLWLAGNYVGAFEDENILSVISYHLNKFTWPVLEFDSKEQAKDIYEEIINKGTGKNLLSLGEGFDDFSPVGYSDGEFLYIVWQLSEDPFFEYQNYPKDTLIAKISKKIFHDVVENFRKEIESHKSRKDFKV